MKKFKKATWNGIVTKLKNRTKEVKQYVQYLIEMGSDHFEVTGDTCYLTTAMSLCIGTKTLPNAQIQSYIEKVANVEWTELKRKNGKIKTFKKSTNDDGSKQDARIDLLYLQETKWYDHEKGLNEDKPHTDVDKFLAQIKSMITRGHQATTEDRVDGDVEQFNTLVEKLEELV